MTEDLNASPNQNDNPTEDVEFEFEVLEAVTRLLVGGVLEGSSEFVSRLKNWEEETAVSRNTTTPPPNASTKLRYALIGALFNAEARFKQKQLPLLKRAGKLGLGMVTTAVAPFTKLGATTGVNAQLDEWAQRGESIVSQWVVRGQVEEQHGRVLARHATNEVFNELFNELAENKELQNLIAEQSTGLAAEALDEARTRTVTADEIAERFVRTILRRPPRQVSLPASINPPEESHE